MTGRAAPALRRYGQNFLVDPRQAERLVDLFDPQPSDLVVEVGPGEGALTRHLVGRVARLIALELDPRMVSRLQAEFGAVDRVGIRQADALRVDFAALSRELGGDVRVIGNLPYNVGSAIVRRLIAAAEVHDLGLMLQKEVVDRLFATPGTKAFAPISVLVQLLFEGKRVATLQAGSFRPRPKVTSSFFRCRRREGSLLAMAEIDRFERCLFRGFKERRKTLAGNLGPDREQVRNFLAQRGLPLELRAEALPAQDWLDLWRQLERAP